MKELLHGKIGVRCMWQRFCGQIGGGVAAARAEKDPRGKIYEDRIRFKLMAAARLGVGEAVVERVTRRALQRCSTVWDLRAPGFGGDRQGG